MPEFLTLVTPEDGLELLFGQLEISLTKETVRSEEALGKITAEDIHSPQDLPEFKRSTVDGYAVVARDTHGASEGLPAYLKLIGEVLMGEKPDFTISKSNCGLIHTGGMLPEGSDAVVMLEDTQALKNDELEIYRPVASGDNVIQIGEDIKKGAVIIPKGMALRPAEIGGLMAIGITEVEIVKPPVIGLISSGDEVIPPEKIPGLGQVRDINSSIGQLLFSFFVQRKSITIGFP